MADSFTLTVTKYRDNPNYATEYTAWKERSRYDQGYIGSGMGAGEPAAVIQDRELLVTLTAEEYEAVKQAVLATFK